MSLVSQIKDRLPLAQYIRDCGIELKPSGARRLIALCPFHAESGPSFTVFEDEHWHCFGCHLSGDLIDFVRLKQQLDFPQAIEMLAKQAGIEIKHEQPHTRLYDLLEASAEFYTSALAKSVRGLKAQKYLYEERRLQLDICASWQVGVTPAGYTSLRDHLCSLKFTDAEIISAGVGKIYRDTAKLGDTLIDRLVIPIRDRNGKLVAFAGRIWGKVDDDRPKWLNTPNTALFTKGEVLFGLHRAKDAIKRVGSIIVEGYFDVIMAHIFFPNTVALMGTAFTKTTVRQLAALHSRATLVLDGDGAGNRSAERAAMVQAGIALSDDLLLDLHVAKLPDGKDPDEMVYGAGDVFAELIESAPSAAQFVIERCSAGIELTSPLATKEKAARTALPLLLATPNQIARDTSIQLLAQNLHVDRSVIDALAGGMRHASKKVKEATKAPPLPAVWLRSLLGSETALSLCIRQIRLCGLVDLPEEMFTDSGLRELYKLWIEAIHQDKQDYHEYMKAHLGSALDELYTEIMALDSLDELSTQVLALRLRRDYELQTLSALRGQKLLLAQAMQRVRVISEAIKDLTQVK